MYKVFINYYYLM